MFGGVEAVEPGTMISQAKKRLSRLGPMMSFPVRLWHARQEGVRVLPYWYDSSWKTQTWWWMWSGSRYIGYRGRWTCRRWSKWWDERAGDNRRWTRGRSWTAHWPEPKTSTYQKTSKPLWWIDSKLPTADVRGQGANKDTETKIAEEGKNTAGKLFILSVR